MSLKIPERNSRKKSWDSPRVSDDELRLIRKGLPAIAGGVCLWLSWGVDWRYEAGGLAALVLGLWLFIPAFIQSAYNQTMTISSWEPRWALQPGWLVIRMLVNFVGIAEGAYFAWVTTDTPGLRAIWALCAFGCAYLAFCKWMWLRALSASRIRR